MKQIRSGNVDIRVKKSIVVFNQSLVVHVQQKKYEIPKCFLQCINGSSEMFGTHIDGVGMEKLK